MQYIVHHVIRIYMCMRENRLSCLVLLNIIFFFRSPSSAMGSYVYIIYIYILYTCESIYIIAPTNEKQTTTHIIITSNELCVRLPNVADVYILLLLLSLSSYSSSSQSYSEYTSTVYMRRRARPSSDQTNGSTPDRIAGAGVFFFSPPHRYTHTGTGQPPGR